MNFSKCPVHVKTFIYIEINKIIHLEAKESLNKNHKRFRLHKHLQGPSAN